MIAIYKTMLKSTGRVVYVGQTAHPEEVGKRYFGSGKNIRKYSRPQRREMFNAEVITTTESQDEANKLECFYIDFYHTLEVYGGFNQSKGGIGGGHLMSNRKDQSKPVLQFTMDGTFVAEYPSLSEAERQTGVSQGSISRCCNGHPHYSHAGSFVWKWKTD